MNGTSLFCFTASGRTGRLITRLRPSMTIVALTPEEKVYHQLAIEWGIIPCLSEPLKTLREAFLKLSDFALEKELVAYGDLVVVSAGSPFGISGTTNMMLIESIGDVLVRGYGGIGEEIHGNVAIVYTSESRRPYQIRGRIIVLPLCDESYYPLVVEAKAVILHNQIHDHSSEEYLLEVAKKLNKPALIRADGAREILKEGQLITLDPQKGLVYKGIVSKEV
jgi:pyruvate kinase